MLPYGSWQWLAPCYSPCCSCNLLVLLYQCSILCSVQLRNIYAGTLQFVCKAARKYKRSCAFVRLQQLFPHLLCCRFPLTFYTLSYIQNIFNIFCRQLTAEMSSVENTQVEVSTNFFLIDYSGSGRRTFGVRALDSRLVQLHSILARKYVPNVEWTS